MHVPTVSELFHGLSLQDLVMWKRPVSTGVVVGTVAVVIFIFGWMSYTWLTFLCRVLQLLLIAYGVLSRLGSNPPTADDMVRVVSRALDRMHPWAVKAAGVVARVVTWEDSSLSLKVLLASVALAMVGNFLSDLTILFLTTVLVFAGPILYSNNREVIDAQLQQLRQSGEAVMHNVPASSDLKKTE